MRRLKKGTKNYKAKFPFKCFSYKKIGHYASRCPDRFANQKSKEIK